MMSNSTNRDANADFLDGSFQPSSAFTSTNGMRNTVISTSADSSAITSGVQGPISMPNVMGWLTRFNAIWGHLGHYDRVTQLFPR